MNALAPAPATLAANLAANLAARGRMLSRPGDPLFTADWDEVLMVHYAVDPALLAPDVPFPLDLHEGRAYVTLVAFNMRGMRPHKGGPLGAWLLRPIASHGFLNVRTYVVRDGEPGIYFLTEHLNHRLSLHLGPTFFGLPYRFAHLEYHHAAWRTGRIAGRVVDPTDGAAFSYRAVVPGDPADYAAPPAGSLMEWLMERYTAYTVRRRASLKFRVWHAPWPAATAAVRVLDDSLLRDRWRWFPGAEYAGAHYSPGVRHVFMGRPRRIRESPEPKTRPDNPGLKSET